MEYGLNYRRRVRDSYERAFRSWEPDGVGANLVEAEIAAGLRSPDDWDDRFQPDVYNTPPTLTPKEGTQCLT